MEGLKLLSNLADKRLSLLSEREQPLLFLWVELLNADLAQRCLKTQQKKKRRSVKFKRH